MCGIIGYIGEKDVDELLLSALSRLEYRGYDSSGMAVLSEGRISVLKQPGKLKALKDLLDRSPLEGRIGIGHTRWATHGEPTERNAHPHTNENNTIAVVHNGIIENYAALKRKLTQEGFQFSSDTDTEVLAHLMDKFHLHQNLGIVEAVQCVLKEIEGTYAFCVISSREPDRFIAARNGSPLVVGLGKGENFVASDATAFVEHTRDVIFLDDFQLAIVTREGAKILTTQGKEVRSNITRIEWDAKDASKEGYDHFMLKEIEEQPKVIDRILKSRISETVAAEDPAVLKIGKESLRLFDALNFDVRELKQVQRILIQACGTSWHSALTGKFLFEGISGLPVEVDVSSEFRYRRLVTQPGTLVLSITQSGETIDTLMGLRRGKDMGYKTMAICNVLGSTIARESDGVIYTHAGPEIGVASTKAYTAQIAVLTLLAIYWGRLRGNLSEAEASQLLQDFKKVPAQMLGVIQGKESIRKAASKYYECRDFLFLGRGINYPNAHEGALKIKEIAYLHATGHPAGEMKHGPIALIDSNMPVVAIAPKTAMIEKMASNIQEVKARQGKVIAIVTEGDSTVRAYADDVIEIPETSEFLSPLLVALPLQYLAYYVAILRGTDVDQPRNLAKSVTVE